MNDEHRRRSFLKKFFSSGIGMCAESAGQKSIHQSRDEGAWMNLDGLKNDNVSECLQKMLLSYDAGWYNQADGSEIRGYTVLFRKLIPEPGKNRVAGTEIVRLIQANPANALALAAKKRGQNECN